MYCNFFYQHILNFHWKQGCKRLKKEENGINIDHFKFGSQWLTVVLSLLFNCMFVHGVTPDELMMEIMSSLIKDARKSQQESENYRFLTIGTCIYIFFLKM